MRNLSLPTLMSCLLAITLPAGAAFLPGKTGEQTRYQLTCEGEGTVRFRGMLTGQSTGADRLRTQLHAQMEILEVTPSLLSVRLLAPDYRMQVNGQAQDLKGVIATLEHPCYLRVDAQGRVQSVSFASSTPVVARSLMRTLVSGLEFARPNTGTHSWQIERTTNHDPRTTRSTAHSWQIEQDTFNGPAQAAYRSVDDATIEKRLIAYPHQREIGPKGMPQMQPATQGALRFTFRHGHLQDVNGAFSTRFTLADRALSEGQERFQLTRLSAQWVPAAALRRLQADFRAQSAFEPPTALHVHDTDPAAQRASWMSLLKGATPASLAADLAAVDATGVRNDAGLYSRLCALLTLQPETCAGFERALATAQPNRLSTRLIVAALAAVAGGSEADSLEDSQHPTPAMQSSERALTGVLVHHKTQSDMVMLVAPAFGMVGAPSRETESLLEALVDSKNRDIVISCALALGGIARHGSPRMAEDAVGFLKRKLATADASLQPHLLAALGNAGSADILTTVAAYTHNASPQLRAAALMSLRLVPGPHATELLYSGLHDSDPDVRLNAARAFQFRPFAPLDIRAFSSLIAAEKTERVRLALLENLKMETPYYPQVRAVLQQAVTHETSAEIRKTVSDWLQ